MYELEKIAVGTPLLKMFLKHFPGGTRKLLSLKSKFGGANALKTMGKGMDPSKIKPTEWKQSAARRFRVKEPSSFSHGAKAGKKRTESLGATGSKARADYNKSSKMGENTGTFRGDAPEGLGPSLSKGVVSMAKFAPILYMINEVTKPPHVKLDPPGKRLGNVAKGAVTGGLTLGAMNYGGKALDRKLMKLPSYSKIMKSPGTAGKVAKFGKGAAGLAGALFLWDKLQKGISKGPLKQSPENEVPLEQIEDMMRRQRGQQMAGMRLQDTITY